MDQVNPSSDSETVKISLPWTWRPVKRRMLPGCEFFRDGDTAIQVARKLIPLENDDAKGSDDSSVKETIPCSVWGCTQTFTSLLSYENHYKSAHCHTCQTCHRTFPSAYLLDVHIEENHDPLFAVLASRQDMYQCLVESCGHKFPAPDPRRQHLITVHSYPANFRFHRLCSADARQRKKAAQSDPAAGDMDIDKPSSLHGHEDNSRGDRQMSAHSTFHSNSSPTECPSDKENSVTGAQLSPGVDGRGEEEGMELSGAEKHVPRRVFVPKVPQNFSFGHGVSRGFQRPAGRKKTKKKGASWHQRMADSSGETTTNIENVDMKDMADALSDVP